MYPRYLYAHDGRSIQVHNEAQETALGPGWYPSPSVAARYPEPKAGKIPVNFATLHPITPSRPAVGQGQ